MARQTLPVTRKTRYFESTLLSLAISLPFFVVTGVSVATPTLLGQTTTLGIVLPPCALSTSETNTLRIKTLEGESISLSLAKTQLSPAPGMQIPLIIDFYDDGSIEYRLDNEIQNRYTGAP